MATYTWYLQGTSPTTIGATDIIQFAGGTFGAAITVNAFNDSTHVESNVGGDQSSANTPHSTKYISSGNYSLDGGGSTALDATHPTTAQCPLKINFSHGSSVVTTAHKIYAYDASTTTVAPTGVTFYIAEQSNTAWVAAGGSAAACNVADDTTATSHDYYFSISASPTSVGVKTAFKIRDELTYS